MLEESYGNEISSTIYKAICEANEYNEQVGFDFNGVNVVVDQLSDAKLILRDWRRGLCEYLGDNPTVGPHPKPELSAEEIASDAAIEKKNEERRAKQQVEYNKKMEAKILALKEALNNVGPLELINPEDWQKVVDINNNGYSGRIVRYAEEWGRLMQVRIEKGEGIAECAEELSHLADDDGITGFMYGGAVGLLAKHWKHGEALRLWHNRETQIHTEGDEANKNGGVLNPALLRIG